MGRLVTFWDVVWAVVVGNLLWLALLLAVRMVAAAWQSTEPGNSRKRSFHPGGSAARVENNWRTIMDQPTEEAAE